MECARVTERRKPGATYSVTHSSRRRLAINVREKGKRNLKRPLNGEVTGREPQFILPRRRTKNTRKIGRGGGEEGRRRGNN